MSGAPRTCIVRIERAASSAEASLILTYSCGKRVWSTISTAPRSGRGRSVLRSGVCTLKILALLQHLDDVVEIVGPQRQVGAKVDRLRHLVDRRGIECRVRVGQEHPVAAAAERIVAVVGYEHRAEAMRLR